VILIFVVVNLSVRSMAHSDDDTWRQASRAFLQLRGEVENLRRQTRVDVERIDHSLRGLWRLSRRLEAIVGRSEMPPSSSGVLLSTSTTASGPRYAMASSLPATTSCTYVPPLMAPGSLPSTRPAFPLGFSAPRASVAMPPLPGAPSPGIRVQINYDEYITSSSDEEPSFPSCDKRCRDCWRFHERGPCQPTTSA
jgi:hypothetical protein